MNKKAFLGLSQQPIEYELIDAKSSMPASIPIPDEATFLLNCPFNSRELLSIAPGDRIKTGQKLIPFRNSEEYLISSVTGVVRSIAPYDGDFGKTYTAVSIQADPSDDLDDQFATLADEPTLDSLLGYLSGAPGSPPVNSLAESEKPIDTIVVFGGNSDILITANQFVIKSDIDSVTKGISILKKVTGIDNIFIVVPRDMVSGFGHTGAELKAVGSEYPAANPYVIMNEVLNKPVPEGKNCEDLGVCFFSAEAVASIGKAFNTGRIPFAKTLTIVKKDQSRELVSARIGTPISDILKACDVIVNDKDRLIIGGPLTGSAIFSEDHPICPDTDAILIQDKEEISLVSDYPCINCGECIRACPANVPVNMLVRFLEAGQYDTAADEYDLNSCFECGLCSYVCVAKIPIFQYIRLAKYELGRISTAEETDD